MMVYQSYQFYQAERPKTAAEIRRADEQLGRMAKNVFRLWCRLSFRSTQADACRGTRPVLPARLS